MPDYANGKIYTIRFHNSNEIYIGSTTQSLAVRFGGHKRQKTSLFNLINNKYDGNWEECYYELYENYSCSNKEELCRKEGEIIRKFKDDKNYDCINNIIAGRTYKEYCIDNIEKEKERYKIYRVKNNDKLKEYRKQYYENNPEYNKQYREKNIEKIKEEKKNTIRAIKKQLQLKEKKR